MSHGNSNISSVGAQAWQGRGDSGGDPIAVAGTATAPALEAVALDLDAKSVCVYLQPFRIKCHYIHMYI